MKKRFMSKLLSKPALIGLAAFAFTAATAVGITVFSGNGVGASDCSKNAIVHCGVSSPKDTVNAIKSKRSPNLKAIFADYGLMPKDYARFVKYARPGKALKDGRIVVDGRTVATNAKSVGRQSKAYSHKRVIAGQAYYESRAQDVFLSNSIKVMVLFNAKGQMQFAVMYDCGNPTEGKLNNPTYSCNSLVKHHDGGNTYSFSTKASAGNGASIANVVYDFGDGSKKVTKKNPRTKVKHTYTKPGKYKTTVTVNVKVPGNQTYAIVPAGKCATTIKVTAPSFSCSKLTKSGSRETYSFSAYAKVANGAKISKVVYNFGDGSGKTVKSPRNLSPTSKVKHTYKLLGTKKVYTIKAAVYSSTPHAVNKAKSCIQKVTIQGAPVFACETLNIYPVNRTDYSFNTSVMTKNNAKVTKLTYNFGDGSTKTATNPSSKVSHTFAKAGTYNVKVTLAGTVKATKATCHAKVTVPKKPVTPTYACLKLNYSQSKDNELSYSFGVDTQVTAKAKITKVVYNFGDGNLKTVNNPNMAVDHTFAKAGTYNVSVTLTAQPGNAVLVSDNCQTTLEVKTTPMCTVPGKEHLPVNSPECEYCDVPGKENLPKDSPKCAVTPPVTPELPNTGAGGTVGIFAGMSMLGGISHYFIKNRRYGHN